MTVREWLAKATRAVTVLRTFGLRRALARASRRIAERHRYRSWLEQTPPPRVETVRSPGPLISILMPTYRPDPRWLARAVESVQAQSYGRWELSIADDGSPDPEHRRALASLSSDDSRIRVVRRASRGHISAASNTALERAAGDFVALLDQDDELSSNALEEVARALARDPDTEVLFSDEDKLDEQGRRYEPYFKPDWSPDLALSQNLVSHLGVYRTSRVREVGGFREGFEGSQDHDLALRVVEQCGHTRVRHIPRVLYHWRATAGSTAGGLERKAYAIEAGVRAIQSHLDRLGRRATAEPALRSYYRVRWALPESPTTVALVTPGRPADLGIGPVQGRATPLELRIEAAHGTGGLASRLNQAVRNTRAEVVVLLGAGCTLAYDALEELVAQALRPEVGVAGGRIVTAGGRVIHGGYLLALDAERPVLNAHEGLHEGEPGHFGRNSLVQNFLAVSAEAMALRRAVFDEVGGFDSDTFPERLFDVDLGLRVGQAGLRVVWTPWARVQSGARGSPPRGPGERERLVERWASRVPRDPFWHPALDRRRGDFRLR